MLQAIELVLETRRACRVPARRVTISGEDGSAAAVSVAEGGAGGRLLVELMERGLADLPLPSTSLIDGCAWFKGR